MPTPVITLGVVPVKRSFTDVDNAVQQKNAALKSIRALAGGPVKIVDIDSCTDKGVIGSLANVPAVVECMRAAKIDGLLLQHCDFGNEEVVGKVAAELKAPVLLWGARDMPPQANERRGGETQCGIFASSKVLQRYGVAFSYIINSLPDNSEFQRGFDLFCRAVSIVKSFKKIRIAQVSTRPAPFMSVICNEGELLERFGIEIVPVSATELIKATREMVAQKPAELVDAAAELKSRIDCSSVVEDKLLACVAVKLKLRQRALDKGCTAIAQECWTLYPSELGVTPCFVHGELTDMGMPVSCETDIHGAITSIMLQASSLWQSSSFFADLTLRHPTNDNAELLWHCGPFPYSLKAPGSKARLEDGRGQWLLKDGDITIARFDGLRGEYSLFASEGKTTKGPLSAGTYAWMEVDDWRKWEEKFIFGPYIHHVSGIFGKLSRAMLEACKFIPGLKPDSTHDWGAAL